MLSTLFGIIHNILWFRLVSGIILVDTPECATRQWDKVE